MINWTWDENGSLFSYPEFMSANFALKMRKLKNEQEANETFETEAYAETIEQENAKTLRRIRNHELRS